MEYALYKGDKLECIGTLQFIAKELGVKVNTVKHYGYPAYAKRTKGGNARRLMKLEDEDE